MTDGTDSTPTLIAHRGFAGENPENTVPAVRRAAGATAADGAVAADWVEVDVMPTADGDPVVVHDAELSGRGGDGAGDRGLTDASGVVWETDTATVTGAEVLDSGATVPPLADVLDAVPPTVGVNVELKNPGRWDLRPDEKLAPDALGDRRAVWRPFVARVLDVVEGFDHDRLFSSFCEGALAAVRALSPSPVAPLVAESLDDGLAIAREHDATAVHPPVGAIPGTPYFDADRFGDDAEGGDLDIVAAAHREGLSVNVWTVRTWHQADRLAAAGVDGLIADYSTLLRD